MTNFELYADCLSDVDTCCQCGQEVREYDFDGYRYWTHAESRKCEPSGLELALERHLEREAGK